MRGDEAPPSSDRRRAARIVACFPSYVDHNKEKLTAMIADLAETGTRLFLREPELKVGEELRLELHISLDDAQVRNITGRVVRIELLPPERSSLWTHEVGVEFDETLRLGPAEVEALEKREAPFGKK